MKVTNQPNQPINRSPNQPFNHRTNQQREKASRNKADVGNLQKQNKKNVLNHFEKCSLTRRVHITRSLPLSWPNHARMHGVWVA